LTTAAWSTPVQLRAQLQRAWDDGRILRARLADEPLFPLSLRLTRPDRAALSEQFDAVRQWIRALEAGSQESGGGSHYALVWEEIRHRQLGRNRVPRSAVVRTETDALHWLGRSRAADRFHALATTTLTRHPGLRDWLVRHPLRMLERADDWERVLRVLDWFRAHPRSGLYLRQIDVPGVDTKFIQNERALLSELLEQVLPPDAIDADSAGIRGFESRYGLRRKPALVRMRILDARQRIAGLSDFAAAPAELSALPVAFARVFVTENEVNGLALPDVPGSAVLFGLGYGLERLSEIAWLRDRPIHYWGDLDTHGFAILDRLRAHLPQVQSFLMDRATLLSHRELWGHEREPHDAPLFRLTVPELALYDDLRSNRLGDRIRLEQEHIAFSHVCETLRAM
jgi:hypothetical protein